MSIARHLEHLAQISSPIECAKMALLAGDHDPPIVVGTGTITPASSTRFEYRLQGMPANVGHALKSLRRLDSDPYDGRLRSRLTATSVAGEELICGWTEPSVVLGEGLWTFTGSIEALSTHEEGTFEPGIECVFLLPRHHTARIVLRRFLEPAASGGQSAVTFQVLGSRIHIELDDERGELCIIASASDAMQPTLLENWVGEPLRILFGQPVYPRFVARRSGDWKMNWVRPSPQWSETTDHVALWQGLYQYTEQERFWLAYRRLLAHIARADGFEAHRLTALYEELIDAGRGSRWVWALTYASTAEAILDIIGLPGTPRADLSDDQHDELEAELRAFSVFMDGWDGSYAIAEAAKRAVARLPQTSATQALRALVSQGVVDPDQFTAWNTLRNRVMHGNLVSPYSSAKDDKLLLDLAGLCRALTWHLIDIEADENSR